MVIIRESELEMTEGNEAYSTKTFINSILQLSFADKHYVSRNNLNRIAYIVAEEYYRATGSSIISEGFDTGTISPSLNSVNRFYSHCIEQNYIEHYMHEDEERVVFINDPAFQKIVKNVWRETKAMPLTLLVMKVHGYQKDHALLAG